jgi:hypothetical protein
MSRWQQIRQGTRARHKVVLPLGGAPLPRIDVSPEGAILAGPAEGRSVEIALRPLASGEQAEILRLARADAVAGGIESPRNGDPLYDLAEMEHTLLLCCVDPDSPQDAPRPFFASIGEIRSSPDLGHDRIAYLFEQFQQFQDECSPQRRHVDLEEMMVAMLELGGEDEGSARRFFELLGPALRWIFVRSMAVQLRTSPTDKLPFSSPSAPSGGASKPPPARPQPGRNAMKKSQQKATKGRRK